MPNPAFAVDGRNPIPGKWSRTKNVIGAIDGEGGTPFRYSIHRDSITSSISLDAQNISCTVTAHIPTTILSGGLPFRVSFMDFSRAMLGWSNISKKKLQRFPPERVPIVAESADLEFFCVRCDLVKQLDPPDIDDHVDTGQGEDEEDSPGLVIPSFSLGGPQPIERENHWPKGRLATFSCTFSSLPYIVKDDKQHTDFWPSEEGDPAPQEGELGVYRDESTRFCIVDDEPHEEAERSQPGEFFIISNLNNPTEDNVIPLGQVPVQRSGYIRRRVQWLNLPEMPPLDNVKACVLKCNKTKMFEFGPEEVILATYTTVRRMDAYGKPSWTRQYEFLCRTDGRTWNEFRSPLDGRILPVRLIRRRSNPIALGPKPYEPASFRRLFMFESGVPEPPAPPPGP
jgi:hypothetical protein